MECKLVFSTLFFLGALMIVYAQPAGKNAKPSSTRLASHEEMEQNCPTVYKMPCIDDAECSCSYRRMICNYNSVCAQISLEDIIRRMPCPHVFKKKCVFDEDCKKCPGLICEDNECVRQKNILT